MRSDPQTFRLIAHELLRVVIVNKKLADMRRLNEKYKKSEKQSLKQHYVRLISCKAQFALALDLNIEFLDMIRSQYNSSRWTESRAAKRP